MNGIRAPTAATLKARGAERSGCGTPYVGAERVFGAKQCDGQYLRWRLRYRTGCLRRSPREPRLSLWLGHAAGTVSEKYLKTPFPSGYRRSGMPAPVRAKVRYLRTASPSFSHRDGGRPCYTRIVSAVSRPMSSLTRLAGWPSNSLVSIWVSQSFGFMAHS